MKHTDIQKEITKLGNCTDENDRNQRDKKIKDNPYPYVIDSLLLITKAIENHTEQLVNIEARLASIEKHLRRSSLRKQQTINCPKTTDYYPLRVVGAPFWLLIIFVTVIRCLLTKIGEF